MRLSEFITANSALIIHEWEQFAKELNRSLPRWFLRDHAPSIVKLLAEQTRLPLVSKAQVLKTASAAAPRTVEDVTSTHVQVRVESGFDLAQIIGEYLALRSCVLRIWRESDHDAFANGAAEIARFGEVIDENVTAAVLFYQQTELQYRDRFLGILGHDLRTPINAIRLNATLLSSELSEGKQLKTVSRLLNSTQNLTGMVEDLLDFARGRLGVPMSIKPTAMDLRLVTMDVIEEVQAAYPGSAIHLLTAGDLNGEWDAERLKQMLSNLLINAVQHGIPDTVKASLRVESDSILIEVENQGAPIARDLLPVLFDPLVRGPASEQGRENLGLGLFIAKEIAAAHKGSISVTSSAEAGTTFAVRLPRTSR